MVSILKDETKPQKGLRFIYHIEVHSINKGIRPLLIRVIWSPRM